MTTTTTSCPYAVALRPENETSSVAPSSPATAVASYKECPVFQQSDGKAGCPFKDKSQEEVRQVLLQQLPKSHLEASSSFAKAVQEIHKISNSEQHYNLPPQFHIGGCPVKDFASAFDVMERNSMTSLMAQLASHIETQIEGEHRKTSNQDITTTNNNSNNNSHSNTDNNNDNGTPPLSQSLKTGTAIAHQAAEDVHFVRNFAHGIIDRKLYAQLVVMMYHVYQTMELLLQRHGPTHFASCHFPHQLERTQALAEDLDFWHGGGSETPNVPDMTPATRDYVQRLHHIAQTDPLLLLAHSYTRYLGDLSGGKILARVAKKALHIDKDAGLAFYEFQNIASAKAFKDEYRKGLDTLPLTQEQSNRLVGEANVAFVLNMRLFEELDVMANVPGAQVRPLKEALQFANMTATTNQADEKCPFLQKAKTVEPQKKMTEKRCPWPFVLVHDPAQGLRDWQTWAVLGLGLCWIWAQWQAAAPVV